jgi:hypothetical protein
MIGRKAILCLSPLCFLLFLFVAQSASAASAANTTAFTCVFVPTKLGDFVDEHCDEAVIKGSAFFKHESISTGLATEFDVTNAKVTSSTTLSEPAVLKSKVFGAKVTVECSAVENFTAFKSFVENSEAEKKHRLKGTAAIEYRFCNVKELAKCIVKEPIVAEATFEGVEGLKGPKIEFNAMGLELKGKGAEETFGTIEFKNKGAEACAVGGKSFSVKGSVIATNGPTTEWAQTAKQSGSTLVFTDKFEMEKLKFGPEAATFTSIVTPFMDGVGGNPITATTTT